MTDKQATPPSTLLERLDTAISRLAQSSTIAQKQQRHSVLEIAGRVLRAPGGVAALYERIEQIEQASGFAGDWAHPERLQPALVAGCLLSNHPDTLMLEVLNELRLAAVSRGDMQHPRLSAEQAEHLLSQIMALNLRVLFGQFSEAERVNVGRMADGLLALYQFLAEQIGVSQILDQLIAEIWRILDQRPIRLAATKQMITQVAVYLHQEGVQHGAAGATGAERLISALFGPTRQSQDDPGVTTYRERLASLDEHALRQEALGMSRSMHDTGLVSPYHAELLRMVVANQPELLASALGLSSTGTDCLSCYRDLVHALIEHSVWPETADAAYGLAGLLEGGVLFAPAVAAALWRQLQLRLSASAKQRLAWTDALAGREPEVRLMAGTLRVLGQPLGIGQGNNPTCQSARALSMWAANDPDYLLQLIAWAGRDDDVVMRFESELLSSAALLESDPALPLSDVDPVSAVTVPHLDALYNQMGRLVADRGEDPHRWINPEFHGWWVSNGFAIAVDVASGQLQSFEPFLRQFYACYHPLFNGNNPVIHPQPAGIAATDSAGRFIGWHAISLLRVGLDPEGVMRVYFFNPNNDSGQDWGQDIRVSTNGCGERFGEGSLPFPEFASRLYIYHFDPQEVGNLQAVDGGEIARVQQLAQSSWAKDRLPAAAQAASPG
jgi:hypothetical protein